MSNVNSSRKKIARYSSYVFLKYVVLVTILQNCTLFSLYSQIRNLGIIFRPEKGSFDRLEQVKNLEIFKNFWKFQFYVELLLGFINIIPTECMGCTDFKTWSFTCGQNGLGNAWTIFETCCISDTISPTKSKCTCVGQFWSNLKVERKFDVNNELQKSHLWVLRSLTLYYPSKNDAESSNWRILVTHVL